MSVINTMLRELDQRGGRAALAPQPGVKATAALPSPWRITRRGALLLSVLAAGLVGVWLMPGPATSPAVASTTAHAAAVAAEPAVPRPTPGPVADSTPAPTAPPAAGAPPPSEPTLAAQAVSGLAPAPAPPSRSQAEPKPASAVAVAATRSAASVTAQRPLPAAAPAAIAAGTEAAEATPARLAAPPPRTAAGKSYSPRQLAGNRVAEAAALEQQGRVDEARALLQQALAAEPADLNVRQSLLRLALESGRAEEARSLLHEGRKLHPRHPEFTLALARLLADGGDAAGAIMLLEAGRADAQADALYHSTLAALQLRARRYDEAVQNYLVALRSDPAHGPWLVGAGAALEGAGKPADAIEAYRRAEGQPGLSAALAAFVAERLARVRVPR